MGVNMIEFLRRTRLRDIPIEREEDRGRDTDELIGGTEGEEHPADDKPKDGSENPLS